MTTRTLNKVMLIGNLGAEPESRTTPSGVTIATISVATSSKWRDKKTKKLIENTEWHRVVLFNRLADVATQYLKKGSYVFIEGMIQTRKWQDSDGNDQYTTEVRALELKMLDSKSKSITPELEDVFELDE